VDLQSGRLHLERILLPVAQRPSSARASAYATRTAEALGDGVVSITRMHVGDEAVPVAPLPESEAWAWHEERRLGDPVEQILEAAKTADLVVMPTDGLDGFLDLFRGSHTERVVREIDCPVLAIPSV
jgi:nucleotide-binding universal stress UspA family protein